MRIKIPVFMITVLLLLPVSPARSAQSGDDARCVKVQPCGKSVDVYQFQDASDSIRSFHTKLWPTQPMKRLGPVKKDRFTWIQNIADTIKGRAVEPSGSCKPCELR